MNPQCYQIHFPSNYQPASQSPRSYPWKRAPRSSRSQYSHPVETIYPHAGGLNPSRRLHTQDPAHLSHRTNHFFFLTGSIQRILIILVFLLATKINRGTGLVLYGLLVARRIKVV